jgi:hypothetical protein
MAASSSHKWRLSGALALPVTGVIKTVNEALEAVVRHGTARSQSCCWIWRGLGRSEAAEGRQG